MRKRTCYKELSDDIWLQKEGGRVTVIREEREEQVQLQGVPLERCVLEDRYRKIERMRQRAIRFRMDDDALFLFGSSYASEKYCFLPGVGRHGWYIPLRNHPRGADQHQAYQELLCVSHPSTPEFSSIRDPLPSKPSPMRFFHPFLAGIENKA